MDSQLTWALVIPTYQREAVLLRCLQFAAQQTLLPKQIIVVDASPNWEETRNKVVQGLVAQHPKIDWQYMRAKRASSATQRNQGIARVTADIVFLIDDDSFMYPECAEEVLRLYAQDTAHKVAGIMPKLEALPPDNQLILKKAETKPTLVNKLKTMQHRLRALAKRFIKDDDIFIPYNFTFPKYPLPKALQSMATHPVQMMHGARMSYRYEILKQVRFEETLERYAVNEDNDVCYRASLFGMLLHAQRARLCHIQHSEGRLTRFTATALWGLNQLVLHCFHSPDLSRFKKLFRKLLWRRLLTQTLKDVLDRRWTLPSMRGVWFVLRHQNEVLAKTPAELRTWYPQFQQTLLDQDRLEQLNQ